MMVNARRVWLLLFLVISIGSCTGISREYESVQECYDSVKDLSFDEIVEVWGSPTTQDEISILPASQNDQDKGVNVNATITCIWNSSKVRIKGRSCISIIFDVVEIPGGIFLPSRVKAYDGDGDCEKILQSNNDSSSERIDRQIPELNEGKSNAVGLSAKEIEIQVKQIRKFYYAADNRNLNADTLTTEADYPYQEIVYTNSHGEVNLITQGTISNACYAIDEYYFHDNKLYFSYGTHDGAGCGTFTYSELRRYIYQDYVIKTLEDKRETKCVSGCDFNSESAPYATLKKYINSRK